MTEIIQTDDITNDPDETEKARQERQSLERERLKMKYVKEIGEGKVAFHLRTVEVEGSKTKQVLIPMRGLQADIYTSSEIMPTLTIEQVGELVRNPNNTIEINPTLRDILKLAFSN